MSYKKSKVKLPFEVEEYRHDLSVSKRIKELKLTYKARIPEIKNLNTGQMWDRLNTSTNRTFQSNPMAYNRIKTAVSYLDKNRKNLTILDIGFGPADFERIVNNKFREKASIVGIDVSNDSVYRAKNEYPRWKFIQKSIEKYKADVGNFDYVIALEVLEHVSPKYTIEVLTKIYKALKNNGEFIISVPLNEGLEKMVKSGFNPNAHVRVYTKELIEAELEIVGFRIVKHKLFYAFHKNYWIKSILTKLLSLGKKPNNVILLAQKV